MEPNTPIEGSSDVSALHQALVDGLKEEGYIQTPPVEAAFCAVPRHLFLPGVAPHEVYCDQAIPIKRAGGVWASSSSQPSIMAIMLEQLGLEPGQRVLEIGTGTGYNAALMAHLVGDAGQVITVDIEEDLVEKARKCLAAAGFGQVQVVCGDGGLGYPSAAPYDRIVLTVGAWDIAPAWREQLKSGGRLLLPLSIKGPQVSVAFEHANGHLASVSVKPCGFIMLRGAFAGPESTIELGPEPGLNITVDDCDLVNAEATYRWLTSPNQDRATTVRVTPLEVFRGLSLWLALREPGFCWLRAEGEPARRGIAPDLFRVSSQSRFSSTVGLLGEAGLCVLMRPPDQSAPSGDLMDSPPFELFVRSFGPDDTLASHLIEQVTAWDAAGRPSIEGLRIRAYPRDTDYIASASESVVVKRWTRLVLDWV